MAIDSAVLTLAAHADYQGLTDQQAADLANTKSITVTHRERRNTQWLVKYLPGGLAQAASLSAKLSTAGFGLVTQMLSGDGIDFGDAATAGETDVTSTALTTIDSIAAGDRALLIIRRVGDNASDTHRGRPVLMGVTIRDT